MQPEPGDGQRNYERASYVFDGTIIAVKAGDQTWPPYHSTVTLKINRLYKGQKAEEITAFFPGMVKNDLVYSSSCDAYSVDIGASGQYVLYEREYEGRSALVAASQCDSGVDF
ncbi:MAG: hypothetical protein ACT4OY_00995 [Alphaproteobacteria bacterium]